MYGTSYPISKTRDKPDHFIFHVKTNDVPSDKNTENIAKPIVDLAISVK